MRCNGKTAAELPAAPKATCDCIERIATIKLLAFVNFVVPKLVFGDV
jgi:hypothetical protein